jgi:hypothetical protein
MTMQQRNWMIPGIAMILLVLSLIVFPSATTDKKKNAPATCCKKSMKECGGENKTKAPGQLIMDNFSRQFISISFFIH